MFCLSRTYRLVFGLAGVIALAGCTSHELVANASRPGKFQLYSCDELDKRGTELIKRERELGGLMQKARQSPGGELAVAIAYQNEYNIVLSDLREVEISGANRNCVLKYRTASERALQ